MIKNLLGYKWLGSLLILGLVLLACSPMRARRERNTFGERIKPVSPSALVSVAKKQIGTRYRYGGEDPRSGFDCSGLVWWCYKELGSSTPRSAAQLFQMGRRVNRSDLHTGDLIFFNTGGRKPGHVGIVTKPPKFVHAPATGGFVREDNLDEPYWDLHYYGARRID